jgi:hypothetical protein
MPARLSAMVAGIPGSAASPTRLGQVTPPIIPAESSTALANCGAGAVLAIQVITAGNTGASPNPASAYAKGVNPLSDARLSAMVAASTPPEAIAGSDLREVKIGIIRRPTKRPAQ